MAARGWGSGGQRVTAYGHRVSFRLDEIVLKLDRGDGYKIL